MEALSGEHADECYKAVDDKIQSLMIRYIWGIFKGSQFLIIVCFLEHGLSSSGGNITGGSINSRHGIVIEWMSRIDCILHP